MRKLFLVLAIGLMSGFSVSAQMSDEEVDLMKSILKSEVKVFFAQNIKLKTSETEQFWELYEAYEEELKPTGNSRIALMKEIVQAEGKLSPEQVDGKIMEAIKLQKKRRGLRVKYYKLYKKKMGIDIAAQFYQLDQYISTLVTASLSEGMPFVVPTDK